MFKQHVVILLHRFKDGKEVQKSSRMTLTYDNNLNTATLSIRDVTEADGAKYYMLCGE
jgi:hypothetical protein